MPGFPVFGPTQGLSGKSYYDYGEYTFYPAFLNHPLMRRYADIHTFIGNNEGGSQMMAVNTELFAMLIALDMMPPASWLPGGKEHRNPLAPTEGVTAGSIPPNPGKASAPPTANTTPITVTYSGASDSGAGLKEVHLWVRKGTAGTWQDTGITSTGASGSFNYTGMSGDDVYYFATRAVNNAAISSAVPSGDGQTITVYDTTPPNPGTLSSPGYSQQAPITISYSGVQDSGSGLKEVWLWFKKGRTGTWQDTGLRTTAAQGTFSFSQVTGDDQYYFFLQAVDQAGNTSAPPTDALVFGTSG